MKYYFIDDDIYFGGVKLPPRKVELFNVYKNGNYYCGDDIDGNDYTIDEKDIIIEI